MNNLINEMAAILNLDAAAMMHHMIELQTRYPKTSDNLVARSLLHKAYEYGAMSKEHEKVTIIYNDYIKAS